MALLYVRPFKIRVAPHVSFLSLAADPARGTATRRYRGGVRGTQFDTAARTAAGDTQLAPAGRIRDPAASAGVSSVVGGVGARETRVGRTRPRLENT